MYHKLTITFQAPNAENLFLLYGNDENSDVFCSFLDARNLEILMEVI